MFKTIRNTIIFGAIALIPFALIVYVLFLLVGFMRTLARTLAPELSVSPYLDVVFIVAIVAVALLALCFVFGLLVRTQLGSLSYGAIDKRLRAGVPGYEIVVNLLRGLTGNNLPYPPALITLDTPGAAAIGFVMEDGGGERVTVFIPTAPVVTAGRVYVVERNRVQLLDASSIEAANCIAKWGIGVGGLEAKAVQ
jgi:uncharacterized membrane protein